MKNSVTRSCVIALIVIALLLGFLFGALFEKKASKSEELKVENSEYVSEIKDLNNKIDELNYDNEELALEIQEKDDAIYSIINREAYEVEINHDGVFYNYSADGTFWNLFSERSCTYVD